MADEQARKGTAANQEGVRHHYDSAKATIRRITRGGEISHERIRQVYGAKRDKLDRREEAKLSIKSR